MLSYPFFRNLLRPGRWQVFAWRRISCKEPTIGSGDRISSFCLLCEYKNFGLLMSACITGEHPVSNASAAALVGGDLFFGLDIRDSATRLGACLWAIRWVVYLLPKSSKERWGKSSLTKRFTILFMGGNHALIDVYDLFLLLWCVRERALDMCHA